jgi:hypothetical protein
MWGPALGTSTATRQRYFEGSHSHAFGHGNNVFLNDGTAHFVWLAGAVAPHLTLDASGAPADTTATATRPLRSDRALPSPSFFL